MVNNIKYYIDKIKKAFRRIFNISRIKKYGFKLAIYDILIFFMHRNNSKFEHMLIQKKDKIVQKYIYKNYTYIVEECKDE